jgi:hypothetical protein
LIPREVGVDDDGSSALRGRQGRGQRRWHALREAGSRSTAVACSEGGEVEVDNDSAIMTKSFRKRKVVARSEAGPEVAACSGAGIEDGRWRWWRGSF